MPPLPESQYVEDTTISPDNLLCIVAEEIKTLRANTLQLTSESHSMFRKFPPVSQSILNSLPGNHRCVDCGNLHPEWATVTYGALLCIGCSGRHRRMGVNVSVTSAFDFIFSYEPFSFQQDTNSASSTFVPFLPWNVM